MSDHSILIGAINSRLQVCFRYKATGEDEATLRTVEPWIYGTKNGKESLYGYQVDGGTVGPKRFDMRRVKHVSLNGDVCDQPANTDLTIWDEVWAEWPQRQQAA